MTPKMRGLSQPGTVPDHPGQPYCGWCGRTTARLEDLSHGGPPAWECPDRDFAECDQARTARLPFWQAQQATGGLTGIWRHPGTAALAPQDAARRVREQVDALLGHRPEPAAGHGYQAVSSDFGAPVPSPSPVIDFDRASWSHTLRNPAHHGHLISGGRRWHAD